MNRSQKTNQRKPGKHKSMRQLQGILLPVILALPGISVSINAWADDNLLVGSGGSSSGAGVLGGGGGIGGGGGASSGGGGGGIAGGGGAYNTLQGDGGGATLAVVIGLPSGAGGIGGGGGSGTGGGGGAIGGSGGSATAAGGSAGQTTGASGGNGSGTTPGVGGVYGGSGGGSNSGGGGGGTVVDGSGAVISGQTPGAGASGATSLTVSNNRSYAYVGVGGGGAGGGSAGATGTAGSAGTLTVDSGAAFSVSRSMLIGGGGGGGGNSGSTGGGGGTVVVNNARLAVSEILLVGGSGGGGNGAGPGVEAGGQGGGGTLTLDHSTLSSATFLVGGNGGNASTFGGNAGSAGNGAATLTNTTATISGGVAVGGIGGSAGLINGGSAQGSGGAGGNGTLTLDQTSMSVAGDMLIGNRGGGASAIPVGGAPGDGASGVGGTGAVTVTQSNLSIAHNLYIGGNGGDGLYIYNGPGHTAAAGGTGLLSVDRGTLNLSGDIFVGGNGGTSYYYNDPNSRANNGGNGANGVLAISNNGIVNVQGGNLVLGGQQGAVMQAGATAAAAGTGTLNLGAGSLNFFGGSSFTIKVGNALNVGNATVNGVAGGAITGLGSVSNNGVINFNQADSRYVFNPGTTGTGSVLQNSAGTTVLAGAMTHTGGTTINAGKLQIGNGGSSGSVSGNITDNATLSFNRQDTATYTGIISGTGNLLNEGSGITVLTGVNLYTGGTTVTAGTLQFGDGGATGSVLGNIVNNGTVAFNRSDSFTYSNIISGSGNLLKSGSGTLSIVGGNVYTGNTTVRAGVLQFDSFTQNAGSSIGIAAFGTGSYGKLVVTGVASLPGNAKINVDVAAVNTLAVGQVLSGVISAGTLNASSFVVSDNSALFNFQADLVGNAVNLTTLLGILPSNAVLANGPSPATGAARILDEVLTKGASGDMGNVVTAMGGLTTERDIGRAVTQMLPLLGGGVTTTMHGMLGSFNRALQNRIAASGGVSGPSGQSGVSSGEEASDRHVWATAFGSRANQGDRDGAAGFSANSWGMMFGLDGEVSHDTTIGLAYAHSNSKINGNTTFTDTAQRADIDSHLMAVYGSKSLSDDVQLDGQADFGRNRVNGVRGISFGGLNRTATSSFLTYSAHIGTALSKNISLSERSTFTPGLRIDYTWLRTPGYGETGADALNLNVAGNTTQALVLTAEGRLRHALTQASSLTAHLGIGYDALNSRNNVVSTFAGTPGQSFVTPGTAHSPWLVSGGVGYALQAGANTQVSLRYDIEGRDGYLNQSVALKANWLF